jgi:hypothetical protein
MVEYAYLAVSGSLKVSTQMKERYRESLTCLREYLSNPNQNVSRSMDVKAIWRKFQMEMKNILLEIREKPILNIR